MEPSLPSGITLLDLITTPIFLILILIAAYFIKKRNIHKHAHFKYFIPGLVFKIVGAFGLCLTYMYYYKGGDTLNYFYSADVMTHLMFHDFGTFIDIIFTGDLNPTNLSKFTFETGTPYYKFDSNSFLVVRLVTPLALLSFRSFITASLLIATISFTGIWKAYTVFVEHFPKLERQMALAFLFLPSVFFWGSGILKDTITLSAVGWFAYSIFRLLKGKLFSPRYITYIIFSSYLLLRIKPYLFYALVPSSALFALLIITNKFQAGFIRAIIFPVALLIIGVSSYILLVQVGNEKDRGSKFSLNNVMDYAVTVQQDLKREEYKGSSFDIGNFDASFGSMAGKAPQAINGALFRPYIWEANNPVMLISSIENLFLLILSLRILFKLRIIHFFRIITNDPVLLFSISFAILVAFAVGVSTSNFGTLVRYKIPALPFYLATLYAAQSIFNKAQGLNTESE